MYITLFAALGIFSVSYFPQLLPLWSLPLVFIVALAVYKKSIALACLLFGLVYGVAYGHWILSQSLPKDLNNQGFLIRGEVVGLPQQDSTSQRFHFRVDDLQVPNGQAVPEPLLNGMRNTLVTLSWRKPFNASGGIPSLVNSGDRWQLSVKLRRPRGFVNPVGFDYQLYLLQQKMAATGYVRQSIDNRLLGQACTFYRIDCWRAVLRERITAQLAGSEELGLVLGLLIGDRQAISTEQWALLKNTGTIHLLAISGLHVGLAALLGLWCGQCLLRLWQWGCGQVYPAWSHRLLILPSLTSIGLASVYGALAGFSLPTQRALIMVIVFHLCTMFCRRMNPWQLLSIALCAIAVWAPLSVRSPGFWLSFLAVSLLLFTFYFYRPRVPEGDPESPQSASKLSESKLSESKLSKWRNRFKQNVVILLKAQGVLTIGLFLPSILWIQGISVSSPFANIIAVPFVSFIIVPLLLVGLLLLPLFTTLAFLFITWAKISLAVLFSFLAFVDHHIGGFWYFSQGEPTGFAVALGVAGVLYLLAPRGLPYRWLALVCFLPVLFPVKQQAKLRLTFLEVGQGTAIVVETAHHTLVYDTGKKFSERFDSGQHIVAPYLLQQGKHMIDMVVTSHGDSDHAGGLQGLLSLVSTDKHLSGEPLITGGEPCVAGQDWTWDGVRFSVLWPTAQWLSTVGTQANSNHYSCVLLIEYGAYRFLLSGDIAASEERRLLSRYPDTLRNITAVLIPHHGSKTSSHRQWVEHLQARYAVVTAGYTNAYGHPHPTVLARYQLTKTQIEHVGVNGALVVGVTEKNSLFLARWRQKDQRYWFD